LFPGALSARRGALAALAFALVAGVAAAAPIELMADGNVGRFRVFFVPGNRPALADAKGLTLYTSKADPFGESVCVGACEQEWPPALAMGGERGFESFTIIVRGDGSRQWAYEGKPLYRSVKYSEPGQANGVQDGWTIVMIEAHQM